MRQSPPAASRNMRFAYADPPYLRCARKLYGDSTYDDIHAHARLLEKLNNEYDGWAYSLTSTTLKEILPLCPADVRIRCLGETLRNI